MVNPTDSDMATSPARERMINRLIEQGISNLAVIDVMRRTPRHLFLDPAILPCAYDDSAIAIEHGQSLSQPYIVAYMTETLLKNGPLHKVLEIGTGTGYQTAVLAQLVDRIFSIERIKPLQDQARQRLQHLKLLDRVQLRHGDGTVGWPEEAGFDGIIVTAAPLAVPPALLEQLAIGGRLIIPVGDNIVQDLMLITRTTSGYKRRLLAPVYFVPMLSGVTD